MQCRIVLEVVRDDGDDPLRTESTSELDFSVNQLYTDDFSASLRSLVATGALRCATHEFPVPFCMSMNVCGGSPSWDGGIMLNAIGNKQM